jgi:hypothetical protein
MESEEPRGSRSAERTRASNIGSENLWKPMMIGMIIGGILVLASFGTFMLLSTDDDDSSDPNGIRLYSGYEGFPIDVEGDIFWIGYNIPDQDPGLYIHSYLHDDVTTLVPGLNSEVEVFDHTWTFVEINQVEEYIVVEVR